jgi:hypothetical protein
LRFRQVGRHSWGRLLSPIVRIGMAVLDFAIRLGLGSFVAPLYPYLVVEVACARDSANQETSAAIQGDEIESCMDGNSV